VLINDGTGHFTDETAERFPVIQDSTRQGAFADVHGNHCLDLIMGNSRAEQNRLYRNDCNGRFIDVTRWSLPARFDTTTAVEIRDLDNDGDLDLYFAKAGEFLVGHGFLGEQNRYLRNNGRGRFRDATRRHFPVAADPSTDAAFGDLDGAGDLDLLIGRSTETGGEDAIYIGRRCPGRGWHCRNGDRHGRYGAVSKHRFPS